MTGAGFRLTFPPGAALIVGGTGALGRAIVIGFASAGSDIAFTYRHKGEKVDDTISLAAEHGRRVEAFEHDLRHPQTAAATVGLAFGRLGQVHSIVSAAGPDIPVSYTSEVSLSQWIDAIATDVHGFFSLVQAAIPHLRRIGGGSITAITTAATRRYPPKDVLSAAPKAAVESVIRAVAREEGRFGIRANAVAPGWVDAGLGARMVEREHNSDKSGLNASIPLRRFGTAEEIAAAVLFLASSQASYVTGQVLAVDGGWQI
jgi:NAD(P)-dependent dehydrogenase (short-subunit alcohol dehydrogenase family)